MSLETRAVLAVRIALHERCSCPECKRLNREHLREGYQLALFPYRLGLPIMRR